MSHRIRDEVDVDRITGVSASEKSPSAPVDGRYVRKVGTPQKENLLDEFRSMFREMFFPDDPLRSFKGQPRSRKLLLGIEAVFPILRWGRQYTLSKFKNDLIAGITIASLCIPQTNVRGMT
ncbi:Solute carrier 26 [Ancistrocladus abbreviatus]